MQQRPSHVVFMGMGEPLLHNAKQVLEAINCLCSDLGMAAAQITVSTVGVARQIPNWPLAPRRLGPITFTLAVKLHAPTKRLARGLIPTAHAYPIAKLP